MVAVSTYSWEELAAPGFADPQRQAFRAAVAQIAAQASAKLPECNGRIESAVKLVLASDVVLGPDGTAAVIGSASDAQKTYQVKPGHCECQDFDRAPANLCKHRLAAAIQRRATTLLTTGEAPESDVEPLAAPAAVPVPALLPESLLPYVVHIKGRPFIQYGGLLTLAQERGLVSLKADFISVTNELALAKAEATFADGRTYVECSDATPANVGTQVRPHFARIALTRAKSRCLRDALGITMVALEELGDD